MPKSDDEHLSKVYSNLGYGDKLELVCFGGGCLNYLQSSNITAKYETFTYYIIKCQFSK